MMIKIAEFLGSQPVPLWKLVKQVGVDHAVATLPLNDCGNENAWDYLPLLRMQQRYADAGLQVIAVESTPPMDKIRLGLPGRDEEIEQFQTLVCNMGVLGIPVLCYNFMAVFGWLRTNSGIRTRGDALVSGFDRALLAHAPLTEAGCVSEERLWENFEYFLHRVLPVAEEAQVKLALHPDDPPLSPIRGVGRIMRSLEAFDRVLAMSDSPQNGITFCQGNFSLMTKDVPAAIRHFGKNIFFVHFRDVQGTPEKFVETFHDLGPTDMLACLRCYHEIGFDGPLRPDHVPALEGETNESAGYASLGRLFAIGYIRGLLESIVGRPPQA
jgi:mannonate dehydratase